MQTNDLSTTNKLMMVIIALLLRDKDDQPSTLKQRVQILSDLGLKPIEISHILARSSTYINKELAGIRKSKKKASKNGN